MEYKEILGILAAGIGFIGFFPYLWSTWRGATRPHIFSWYLWALFNGIAGAAQWVDGGGAGAWVNLTGAVITLIIAIMGTMNGGRKDIARSDWYALYGALIAVGLWFVTQSPLWSIILLTFIDAIAFFPTFRKGWIKPYEDMASVFSLSGFKQVIGIFALENYSITTTLFPASLVLTNLCFVLMLLYRRRQTRRNQI